jgi:beta-galactosidase
MADRKGLIAPVKLGGEDFDRLGTSSTCRSTIKMLAGLKFRAVGAPGTDPARSESQRAASENGAPAFWRGTFNLEKAGRHLFWMWVNGHCLGRYWNIGPTQTAYAPGCWLHAGENEIVILDLTRPGTSGSRKSPDSKSRS